MEDLTGKQFGSYQIVAPLGEGGMAAVYKAHQPSVGRYVALKVLPRQFASDPQFVTRFEHEARLLAQLQHPHILPIFDFGEAEGYAYLVMPFIKSGTLAARLTGRPFPLAHILTIISQIGEALDYAHARGLIHRDVKPSNVLVDESDNYLLSDFGLAKLVAESGDSKLTASGAVMGTPAYMSPEQGLGQKLDGRSDLYSLGVILYELATGRLPFNADTPMAVVSQHISAPLPSPRASNPVLNEMVERVIIKALAKDPSDRYLTAGGLTHALREALSNALTPISPLSRPTTEAQSFNEETQPATTPRPNLSHSKVKTAAPKRVVSAPALSLGVVLVVAILFGGWAIQAQLYRVSQTAPPVIAALATATIDAPQFTPTLPTSTASATQTPPPPALTQTPTSTATTYPTDVPTPTLGVGSTAISDQDSMVLVYVPAGDFLIGSDPTVDHVAVRDEKPQRTIYLNAFWLDRTEVTNSMYAQCVQAGDCLPPSKTSSMTRTNYYNDEAYAHYPVIYVSWYDAQLYCKWAGRRLPTEAEWEKAARGPNGFIYPWGNTPPDISLLNFDKRIGDTIEVGRYLSGASPYGALDMAGNVWEWVVDWYARDYYATSPIDNPSGPDIGTVKLFRGGSWNDASGIVRSAIRYWGTPDRKFSTVGFRCSLPQN